MMFGVYIGRYVYDSDYGSYHIYSDLSAAKQASIDNRVKSYDHILHKSLDEIRSERCLSTSGQIKKLRRGPQYWKSIIKPILEQESMLSKHFSKEEFAKFPLLWIAVLGCYQESAELLVRSGADVNEPFGHHHPQVIDEKWTVLHVLIQMDPSPENERLIRLVVDHGADLQARDYLGQTVLHRAVKKDRVKMTEMLLEKGADVNDADDGGWTPLLLAVNCDNCKADELVTLLMKHGADIFVKNSSGMNILHCLSYCYDEEDVVGMVRLTRFFIDKGVPLGDKDHDSHRQPIHFAASSGNNKLVKLYLDYGVNVNALSMKGESPLHLAVEDGIDNLVVTLLERGANIHLRTKEGRTALHTTCQHLPSSLHFDPDRKYYEICIRLLLSVGADVLAEDFEGNTPLALVTSRENGRQPGKETWPLIEALALKKALQPSIELKDEKIIERYQNLREYYQRCTDEIGRMKSTKFIESCTFFELLTESRCRIAELMRNPNFETKFKLHDLDDEFSIYAEGIVQDFEGAQHLYNSMLEQENVINEAFHNMLPYVVARKVVHYIFNKCENFNFSKILKE